MIIRLWTALDQFGLVWTGNTEQTSRQVVEAQPRLGLLTSSQPQHSKQTEGRVPPVGEASPAITSTTICCLTCVLRWERC